MPDWVKYVRQHLSLPNCSIGREAGVVEELAQQLEDAYQEGLQLGLSEQEALLAAQRHVSDWPALANELMHAGIGQTKRVRHPLSAGHGLPEMDRRPPLATPDRLREVLNLETKEHMMGFRFRIASMIEMVRQDLRYAARTLTKKPLFTFVIILTLAIGIGANTAIFSVVNSVLLRPLPYPDASRLTVVWSAFGKEGRAPSSGPELISLRERSRLFDQFAGIWVQSGALIGKGEPKQVKLGWVTSNFLSLLSARPQVGRYFLPQEEGGGTEEGGDTAPVVVLSYKLWQRRYDADPK